jgi:hypothetical protein
MWYKEKYRIVTENPYNKEKLNGLGLVIYSEWKDSFVNIIQKNEIKHLFLNYSLGWKCSDYTFFRYIKPIETLEIIDTHSVGIKNVEQQHELATLCPRFLVSLFTIYFSCNSLFLALCTQIIQATKISAIGGKIIKPLFT